MIRKLIFILAGALVALIVASLLLPVFINPNNFKAPITRQLEQVTGYHIVLGGNVSMRMLPFAHLRAENVSIADADKTTAELGLLDVGVRLLPLLRGKVEITKITLEKPVITIVHMKSRTDMPQAPAGRPDAPKASTLPAISLAGVNISDGKLTYTNQETGLNMTIDALNVKVDMDAFDEPATISAKAIWNGKPIAIKARLDSLAAAQSKKNATASFSLTSEPLTMEADGTTDLASFNGKISARSPSLLAALNWLSGKQQKAVAPLVVQLKGTTNCSITRCSVMNAELKLNDTLLSGSAAVNMASARPSFSADFVTKNLDLTPYMQQKKASLQLIKSAYAAEERWSNAPIDLSFLNMADGGGMLNAERFVAGKFTADKALLRIKMIAGMLTADIGFGDLYQGKGNGTINVASDGRVDGVITLDNVDAHPLVQAFAGSSRFRGTLNTRTTFKSTGKSERALVSNLSGNGQINITNGSITGIDIANMVRNVKSAFTNIDTSQRKTDFSEMGGSFTITNGIISNNDLTIKAPLFRVGGAGTINLPDYRINYRLTPQFVDTLKGQGAGDKQGIGIPILVSGPLDNPVYAPDAAGLIQEAIKDPQKMKENIKDLKGLLKSGKGLLKGL